MNRIGKVIVPVLFLCISGVIFCCTRNNPPVEITMQEPYSESSTEKAEAFSRPQEPEEIWVYVCGHVKNPGVFCLDAGSRVYEAIEMAEGPSEEGSLESLNLAAVLEDGQQIYVPDEEECKEGGAYAGTEDADKRININTASAGELTGLPGIGEAKAAAIIAYREKHSFQSVEDIMHVPGIKERLFVAIRDLIRV